MIYSLHGGYPTTLPDRIRLSSGLTRTDSSSFTSAELEDAGYILAPEPPAYDSNSEKREWNSETHTWDIVPLTEEEVLAGVAAQWSSIREERDTLLQATDLLILMAYEAGGPISDDIKSYRQDLRDIPQLFSDPQQVVWPVLNQVLHN